MNKQNQKAGDGSLLVQAGVVNVHNGLTASDVLVLAETVIKTNLPILAQEAAETAYSRAAALINETVQKAIDEKINDFSSLSKPRKQNDLLQAQKGFAFSDGNDGLKDVLKNLLLQAMRDEAEHSLNSITASEAITVAPSLTSNQIRILSLMYSVSQVVYHGTNSLEGLAERIEKIMSALNFDTLDFDEKHFVHLEYFSCITINAFGGNVLATHYSQEYPGLFSKGYTSLELENELGELNSLPANTITKCLNDPDKLQPGFLNQTVLSKVAAERNINSELQGKLTFLINNNHLDDDSVKRNIEEKSPFAVKLFTAWETSPMSRCRLNGVSSMIAHNYLESLDLVKHEYKF